MRPLLSLGRWLGVDGEAGIVRASDDTTPLVASDKPPSSQKANVDADRGRGRLSVTVDWG